MNASRTCMPSVARAEEPASSQHHSRSLRLGWRAGVAGGYL